MGCSEVFSATCCHMFWVVVIGTWPFWCFFRTFLGWYEALLCGSKIFSFLREYSEAFSDVQGHSKTFWRVFRVLRNSERLCTFWDVVEGVWKPSEVFHMFELFWKDFPQSELFRDILVRPEAFSWVAKMFWTVLERSLASSDVLRLSELSWWIFSGSERVLETLRYSGKFWGNLMCFYTF